MAIPRRTEKMSPVTPPRTPSTVRDISLDLGSKESLSQNIRQPNMTQIGSLPAHLAASKEELSGVPDEHGHVHGPQCGDTTHDEASDWEDTDEERERPAATDEDDNDPRGPRWTWELPTRKQVRKAADLNLYDEWGNAIPFKDLLPPTPPRNSNKEATNQPPFRRLVVFFIGHWWCGLCHDYALMSVARLSQAALIREGVRVALVSSGTWKAIAKYRATLEIPFPVYVDRGTRLFASLGMATSFPNPFAEAMIKERPKYHRHAFARQMATGLARGMRITAFKGLPGNMLQLGGEFVFAPGYKCEFAHRMQGRGDHCEAPDVLQAVGVDGEMPQPLQQLPGSMTRLHSDSSVGSVTLVTRIKSGISNGSKAPKSVGLDEELREGFEAHDVALKPTSSPQLVSSAKVIV